MTTMYSNGFVCVCVLAQINQNPWSHRLKTLHSNSPSQYFARLSGLKGQQSRSQRTQISQMQQLLWYISLPKCGSVCIKPIPARSSIYSAHIRVWTPGYRYVPKKLLFLGRPAKKTCIQPLLLLLSKFSVSYYRKCDA